MITLRDIGRLLRPLQVQLSNLVSRATVKLVDDSKGVQSVQAGVLNSEVRAALERVQQYGFTSVPLAGAEAVVVFPGGDRGQGFVIAADDRVYRIRNLAGGEVAVYDSTGSKIVLKSNGDIQIVPSSGNVAVTGTLTASVDVVGGGKSLKTHTHPVSVPSTPFTGNTGGPT